MKTKVFASTITILALVCLLGTVSIGCAELVHTEEGVIITHYPEVFDRQGVIDHIDRRGLVVDDVYYAFAGRVKYMLPRIEHASIGNFKVGQQVGFLLNDQGQLTTLCLIKRLK